MKKPDKNGMKGIDMNKSFTLKDILLLIDSARESNEHIIVSETCEKEDWIEIPANSFLLWNDTMLNREVDSIGTYDGMLQIWLGDE